MWTSFLFEVSILIAIQQSVIKRSFPPQFLISEDNQHFSIRF